MSTEKDVPLGEGSRRYYEQKFGDRIRQVSKGGGSAPRRNNDSSNWNGRAGCGVAVAVIMVIRLITAFLGSSSHTTSRSYSLPPPPPPPPQINGDPFANNRVREDEAMKRLGRLLENPEQIPGRPARVLNKVDRDILLTMGEVPLLEGLCYRLNRERLRVGETPGKHFLALIDPDVRALVIKSANGQALDANERAEILEGLNEVLQHNLFWNPNALARLCGKPEYTRILDTAQRFNDLPPAWLNERRKILELCYPAQIVPLAQRNKLDAKARDAWLKRARLDLAAARRENQG